MNYNILFFLPIVYGIYFFFTGLWPVVHMPSFIWVTGPKEDLWLVRTVGLVLSSIGLSVLVAGIRSNVTLEIVILAVSASISLAIIDVYYAFTGEIWPVYLLDAVLQMMFLGVWSIILVRKLIDKFR